MPGGRPTKYTEDILEKTREYVKGGYAEGDDFELIPTVEGLSGCIDIRVSTIYEWAKDEDKIEFSEELGKLKAKQAKALIRGGLGGSYNATIAKLLLHGHGHSDTSKTTVAGDPENPLVTRLHDEDRAILERFKQS